MRFYKLSIAASVLFIFYALDGLRAQEISFNQTASFYPDAGGVKQEDILWGHLTVPENWESPSRGNKIKIAVAVLKNTRKRPGAEAVAFIQGGPGAGGIETLGTWLDHPLREKHDIILVDARGTGFSQPRLCPDLGKEILAILAKNQPPEQDTRQKTAAALACRQDLLKRGVDINAYHSLSVAKDLHALKNHFKYNNWHVYGVSYGTYIAQVYAGAYPGDIKSLLLDSPIADISSYYTHNTSNYVNSLNTIFERCRNDADCNRQYPDLEAVYYQTIADLEKNPLTVPVDKSIAASGAFTYNAEDFKVAVQQALYHRQLVEVLPLVIYQFNQKNKAALGNLSAAFASLLGMDYGAYYCASCKEALPNNKLESFNANAAQYAKLRGGLSFYKSDFSVCSAWNQSTADSLRVHHDLSKLATLSFPVIALSGGYDPITPAANSGKTAGRFGKGRAIVASAFGHAPGFTRPGKQIATDFVNNPTALPDGSPFEKTGEVSFVKNIRINPGVAKMGQSLNQLSLIFLLPIGIALVLAVGFILVYVVKITKGRYVIMADKIIRGLTILTSILGISLLAGFVMALLQTAQQNHLILAFGLPDAFSYLSIMLVCFAVSLVLALAYFVLQIKKISNRSVVFSVLFSDLLISVYFLYWGIL